MEGEVGEHKGGGNIQLGENEGGRKRREGGRKRKWMGIYREGGK